MPASAAAQLDNRLTPLRGSAPQRPPRGWIRAIREALGMSSEQLADRMGVTQSMVSKFEATESKGTIRLSSLARVAEALDCTLVYALVPNDQLEERIQARALQVASSDLRAVDRTMALEAQQVDDDENETLKAYARELVGSRRLWDRDREHRT